MNSKPIREHPLVTVITATRDRKESLRRLLESIRAQTYPNIEHVVVDGLSSDGTQALLKKYESRPQYRLHWISEKDRHQVEALNKGLRMAKGEFVTITHDDDYWLPDGIEELMRAYLGDPSLDIVFGDNWGEYSDGSRVSRKYRAYSLYEMVNKGYEIPQQGSIFRREWLPRVGYLNEALQYIPEYEFFLRVIDAGGTYRHVSVMAGVEGIHDKRKSHIGSRVSWEETRRVNRAHGGALISIFTILYLKNRYLEGLSSWIKKTFPSFFNFLKKALHSPEY